MHNCRETKERITELLLDGAVCSRDEALSEELRRCADCRAEFSSLNAVLRMTNRFSEAAAPTEIYWVGYYAKLRRKLSPAKAQRRKENHELLFAALRLCGRTFVPVPVPVCIALLVTFLILSFFAMRGIRSQKVSPPNPDPAVVHVPLEVPVVQEKIVTRVVYRERRPPKSQQTVGPARVGSTFAKSQKPQTEETPVSLVGFKPTDDIKLTVIKGGSSNEK